MATNSSLAQRCWPVFVEGVAALGVALLVYGVSCLLVWPDAANKGFGEQFQRMSIQPFALAGQFPHRILAPLLCWICGMGGPPTDSGLPGGYAYFARGLHVVMLACVFLYARRLGAVRLDAALVAFAVGVTAPVQMYKQHWVGLCDPLSYSLFLLAAMCARHTAVFWLLFLGNLLTHELALFLLPWLWFLRRQERVPMRADLPWCVSVGVAYAAFYFYVKAMAPQQAYSYVYFVEHPLLPWGAIFVWAMALTHWLLAFGPVLAVLVWHQHSRGHGQERWQFWIVVAGIVAILGIAFDWMRHANLVLLPFVLASARFLTAGHRGVYAALVAASGGLLYLVPPWSGTAQPTSYLYAKLFELVLDPNLPQPTDFFRIVTHWIPAVWSTLLVVYALLAVVWLVGFALARRDRRALPAA